MGASAMNEVLFRMPHIDELKHQKVNKNVKVLDGKLSLF